MNNKEQTTLEKIKTHAKKEFLEKTFKGASLRNIVKNAGVTTGAFYGYFQDKEALFNSLVEEHANMVENIFKTSTYEFNELPQEYQISEMHEYSSGEMQKIVNYILGNVDSFRLLFLCADGTKYENFIDVFVNYEIKASVNFIKTLRDTGHEVSYISEDLYCRIIKSFFNMIFNLLVSDLETEEILKSLSVYEKFYAAGWDSILGTYEGAL